MRAELENKVVSIETEKRLSLKEKISYGFGDFGNGFMFDLGQIYLLKYFTDVAEFRPQWREVFFSQQALCGCNRPHCRLIN